MKKKAYFLFYNVLGVSDYTASILFWVVNKELEIPWEKLPVSKPC